jgi:prophage tail gpP-like protein
MPTQADKAEILIGGEMHRDWSSYEIDSDLLIPADEFHMTLGAAGALPLEVSPGAPAVVLIGGEKVMTGRVDEVEHSVSKTSHCFTITGRDKAADLVDCSAPVFTAKMVGLKQLASKIVGTFGLGTPRINADGTLTREKINIEPGDSAWDALSHAAEANGLWPWFEPDGTLVIGGPDYSTPEVAMLIVRKDGRGNNVESISVQQSMHGRYSHAFVLGQTHGTDLDQGKNALFGGRQDKQVTWYRPKVLVDHEADSVAVCRNRANKFLMDGRLNGLTIAVTVKGHRIVAPGQPSDGMLWKPGQRMHVKSEPHGIDGTFFLVGRKFTRSRMDGTRTVLRLKEDGVWVLDAHPHKNSHRRGKNNVFAQVTDVGAPAW